MYNQCAVLVRASPLAMQESVLKGTFVTRLVVAVMEYAVAVRTVLGIKGSVVFQPIQLVVVLTLGVTVAVPLSFKFNTAVAPVTGSCPVPFTVVKHALVHRLSMPAGLGACAVGCECIVQIACFTLECECTAGLLKRDLCDVFDGGWWWSVVVV